MGRPDICMPILAVAALLFATALPAAAQQEPGGKRLTFGVAQRGETGRNLDLQPGERGASSFSATTLFAGLSSVTRRQALSLSVDATLRTGNPPGLEEGGLALRYRLRGAGTALSARVSLRRQEVAFLSPLDLVDLEDGALQVPEDLGDLSGRGWRNDSRLSLSGQFRTDRRLSFGVTLAASRLSYEDTTASGLRDSRSLNAALTARLDLAPDMVLSLRPGLAVQQQKGGARLHSHSLGARLTRRQRGGSHSVSVEALWPEASAARLSLTAGLTRALGPAQDLSLSLGTTMTEGGDPRFVTGLSYLRRMTPRDRLSLSLDRRVRDEADGAVALVTAARGSYARALDRQTTLRLGGTYVATESARGGRSTRDAGLTLSVGRQLARGWVLDAGLRRSLRADETAGGDAVRDAIFVSLGRDWSRKF